MLCGRLREASAAAGGQAAPDSSTASVYAIWRSPAGSGASGQEKLHVLLDLRRDTSPTCLHAAVGLADAAEGVEELYGVSLRPKAEDGASPGDSLWALLCTATASPHGVVPVFLNEKGTQPAAVAVRHFLAAYQKDVLIRVPPDVEQASLQPVDDATGLQLYRGIVHHLLDAREQQATASAVAAAAGGPECGGGGGGDAGAAHRPVAPKRKHGAGTAVGGEPAAVKEAREAQHHPA